MADPTRLGEDDLDLYWDRLARTGGREAAYAMLTQLANDERMAGMLPRLKALTCDTLVIWGERDAIVPREHAERLREAIRGADLQWVDGCGHAVAEERPAALTTLVREHLGATA
ncbi:alpha/beta fold hydrolase [Nannocystis pusilla]|uniref:Alpha/beta fold hydrolase n=1 Tax=Nannocystis pusilla TaxID=889268 RepID=A0A9X3EPL3_9BACT|nr:alpha/beta fold hydrolase [Nannocystis pusilla]MCY1007501.1 alpha/beta fold hydrolase [Nannocystis pusilla]